MASFLSLIAIGILSIDVISSSIQPYTETATNNQRHLLGIEQEVSFTCVIRKGAAKKFATSSISCASGETMVSCGLSGTHYVGGTIIQPSSSNTCTVLSHDPVQNTAAAPVARCCTFPSGVITGITTKKSSNAATTILTTCPSNTALTGCNVYYASGNKNQILGAFAGNEAAPPQTSSWRSTDNVCTSGCRPGTKIWGGAQCLHISSNYRLDCVTKAKFTNLNKYGTCSSGYTMMSCLTWTTSVTLDAWYIQSDGRCFVQQDNHQRQYANAICCKLIKVIPTPQPTPAPTGCFNQGVCSNGYMDQTNGQGLYRDCGASCPGRSRYTTEDTSVCECACVVDSTCQPTPSPTGNTKPPTVSPTSPTGKPSQSPTRAPTRFYGFKCVTRDSAINADVKCNANEEMVSCGFSTVSSTSTKHKGGYVINNGQNGEAEYCHAEKDGDDVIAHARCCDFTPESGDVSCIGYDRGTYELSEGKHSVSCSETAFDVVTGCSVYSPTNVDDGSYPNGSINRGDGGFAFNTDYPLISGSCTLKKGSGNGGAKATLSCCNSPNFDMNCVTRWGTWNAATRTSVVKCSDAYELMGCSVDSDDSVANAWYISQRDECIVRSQNTKAVYAVATCCKLDTDAPSAAPSPEPTPAPTNNPTPAPTEQPTDDPTIDPTADPTVDPTVDPTADPTMDPTIDPTSDPTIDPTQDPTIDPTIDPTADPTVDPTIDPTADPTADPTKDPSPAPSSSPTPAPSNAPTTPPTSAPTTNCPAVKVTVSDVSNGDVAWRFDGLYADNGQYNGKNNWIIPQIPTKNVQHTTNDIWRINGDGGVYLQITDSSFLQEFGTSLQWTYSATNTQYAVVLKCVLTASPIAAPTAAPTVPPTAAPSYSPSTAPTFIPTADPTIDPTADPTEDPTSDPTIDPTIDPTADPTADPTIDPTADPTIDPTADPTMDPTIDPTADPTIDPTNDPTVDPTTAPSGSPSQPPTTAPTGSPTTYCPVLNIRVWNQCINCNSEAFNGVYVLNPSNGKWFGLSGHNTLSYSADNNEWSLIGNNWSTLKTTSTPDLPINDLSKRWYLSPNDGVANMFEIRMVCTGSFHPTGAPTGTPTSAPTSPTTPPTTGAPSTTPTKITRPPTNAPTAAPSAMPTVPSLVPTNNPTADPTDYPTWQPTGDPTESTMAPSKNPTESPVVVTDDPTVDPSVNPTSDPTIEPTMNPLIVVSIKEPTVVGGSNGGSGGLNGGNDGLLSEGSMMTILPIVGGLVLLCLIVISCVMYRAWRNKKKMAKSVELQKYGYTASYSPRSPQTFESTAQNNKAKVVPVSPSSVGGFGGNNTGYKGPDLELDVVEVPKDVAVDEDDMKADVVDDGDVPTERNIKTNSLFPSRTVFKTKVSDHGV